ncbi:sugar phosphate isomerase/epimerase [Candidatus Poribacteria bacterium]|nr:sugar phosphate isomerase/epimerase [Candidatus Poribacteria bacterium]
MRLGGPIFDKFENPDQWLVALRRVGYSAAFCPVNSNTSDDVILAYARAAEEADVVIAEVGAWSNPMSPDETTRRAAIERCQEQLALADKIRAQCCVNISGSRGQQWDGHHPDNLTEETFDLIVETVRKIIDAVKPTRTFYTLETMPWMYPDSVDSYLRLIHAIDRKQFAVHLDPVNLVCSPQRFYNNGALIRECVEKLGQYIKSCHAKDIALSGKLTVHLDEVRPGLGGLDYRVYLQELNKLSPDIPLMLEHLPTEEEYTLAASHIRAVAKGLRINIK